MDHHDLNEDEKQFLLTLYDRIDGSTSGQASMYDIGTAMGCDKPTALKIAEALMGMDAVEVRTLSGAIGLTAAGIGAARKLGAGGSADTPHLGDGPVIDEAGRDGAEALVTAVKAGAGTSGLEFDDLTELVADLRTIDAQLMSSRPKTAILRECFKSLQKTLSKTKLADQTTQIDQFIN